MIALVPLIQLHTVGQRVCILHLQVHIAGQRVRMYGVNNVSQTNFASVLHALHLQGKAKCSYTYSSHV